MSAPPGDGYGQQDQPIEYHEQQPYGETPQQQAAPQTQPDAAAAKKKKRAYAAGAFDVGTGANATAGGQPVASQQGMPGPTNAAAYGSYPDSQPQPMYGGQQSMPQQPAYGHQQPPMQPGYGDQLVQPQQPHNPAVGGDMTQAMANMTVAPRLPPGAQQQQSRPVLLNQLYPTDLLSNPFSVSELDLPPPPIVLPSNVCVVVDWSMQKLT